MNPQDPITPPEQSVWSAAAPTEPAAPAPTGLLRIYPTPYWQQHGEEIAALRWDARQEATGWMAHARDNLDLLGHAVRVRLGIASTTWAGRVLAAAAPFVLVGGASSAVIGLASTEFTPESALLRTFGYIFNGLLALALLCAVAGRWTWARPLALLGAAATLVVTAVAPSLALAPKSFLSLGMVLLLCAPPDLQPLSLGSRWAMAGTAAAMVLPPVAGKLGVPGLLWTGRGPWPVIVMGAIILASLVKSRSNPAVLAGTFLATLPWFCTVYAYHPAPLWQIETGTYVGLLMVACACFLMGGNRGSETGHPVAQRSVGS